MSVPRRGSIQPCVLCRVTLFDKSEFMPMRISLATSSLCLLLWSASTIRVVEAQVQTDSGSQRILPLPEGRLSDFQTQMELLQRLRSLVESSRKPDQPSSASPEDAPKIDARQMEQLQQALQQLQSQLPPGMTPPDLGSIPKDQVDQAMANPAVQQQLKEMLEQFSRDGLLPKGNDSTGSSPMPPQKSWQSLKDAMKKLSEIAQGGKQKPQNETDSPASSTEPPTTKEPTPATGVKPKQIGTNGNGKKIAADIGNPRPAANGTESNGTNENDAETDDPNSQRQQSLQAFQEILERYKKAQQEGNHGTVGGEAELDDNSLPEIRPGTGLPHDRKAGDENNQGSSNRILRRPDRAAPIEPPLNSDRRMSRQGEVVPPLDSQNTERFPRDIDQEADPGSPSTNTPAPNAAEKAGTSGSLPKSSSDSPPSVSEFLQQQFRDGFPSPGSSETDQRSMSRSGKQSPSAQPPGGSSRDGSVEINESNSANRTAPPNMDVRQELEKRGLRGTLQKLVEKARQESNSQQAQGDQQRSESTTNQSGNPNDPTTGGQSASNAGFRKSIQDLLGGLDHRMEDIAKDAEFRDRPANPRSPSNSEWQPAPSNSGDRSNKWNSAASNFFKDISTAPQAPSVAPSFDSGGSSISAETPVAIGSLLLVGLGLLGLVGIIVFLMRRPLMKIVSSATGIAGQKQVVRAGDIRSRDDVITAFHQLALNPKQIVEAWWTHQAAARTLAAASPQQEVAVQTLAEIYEQARYLPEDVELPADQIQSARSALAQCQ